MKRPNPEHASRICELVVGAPYQSLLSTLTSIGEAHGAEPSAVAIRFILDRPEVAAVITGGTRRGQMARNVAAFSFALSGEDQARISDHLQRAPGPPGDVFELERDRDGPHGRIMKYDLNRD